VGRVCHVISGDNFELLVDLLDDVLIQFAVRLVEGHAEIVLLAARLHVFDVIHNLLVEALDECHGSLLLEVLNQTHDLHLVRNQLQHILPIIVFRVGEQLCQIFPALGAFEKQVQVLELVLHVACKDGFTLLRGYFFLRDVFRRVFRGTHPQPGVGDGELEK